LSDTGAGGAGSDTGAGGAGSDTGAGGAVSTVEVVAIGDELLRGIVAESNAHAIARRVAARGSSLTRATTLPDDPVVVSAELRLALARAPSLLVTHGGLGPTDDDRTRAIVARAVERPQERHPAAEEIVRRRYADLAAAGVLAGEPNEARLRMADLPAGAVPLDNQVGTAPAFVLDLSPVTFVALPGVPAELLWIWENSLAPLLDRVLGPGGFAEVTHTLALRDESLIAGLLERVASAHEGVYIKSRASGFSDVERVRITLHALAGSNPAARAALEAAERDLRAALSDAGVALQ
jgi:molybdopterin-biosynthesis enzyme MoeA-like protein